MRVPRLASVVVLAVAVAVGTTSFSDATFTSRTASGVSTVSAAADWTPPTVSLVLPGSPLTGTVQVEAGATDPEGPVTTIRLDISAAGSGQWWQLCTSAGAVASCSWDTTTVQDGAYDVRATAIDSSQNTAEDTVAGVSVDNVVDR